LTLKNIGRALAVLRQERSLSQHELASRCGIGRSQISKYEAGKETMKLDTLGKLLGALNVEPEQFFQVVRSIEESLRPRQARRDRIEERVLRDAFRSLHSAIDNLQLVIERSLGPESDTSPIVSAPDQRAAS
jgi:transcriptional regulator with XRE-family HTH domain